jgi:hypothetical protein
MAASAAEPAAWAVPVPRAALLAVSEIQALKAEGREA